MSRAARFFCLLLPLLAAVPATHSDTNDYSGQVRVTLESPLVDDARSGNALGVDEITISWRFWILMGEPVKTFVGTYRTPEAGQQRMRALARVADLDECRNGQVVSRRVPTTVLTNQLPAGTAGGRLQSITLFRAWLAESSSAPTRFSLRREKLFIDFSPDSLMPEHAGVGLSTPGSPEWGELFQRSSLRGGSEYLSADEAKAVFRRGISIDSVEIIRASVDVSALRSAYNNSVRESCEKAEEEKNAKIAERFKRRVEQLVASEEAPEKPEKPEKSENIERRLDHLLTGKAEGRGSASKSTSLDDQLRDLRKRQEAERRAREEEALQARLEALEVQRLRAREECDKKAPVMRSPGARINLGTSAGPCYNDACREARRRAERERKERARVAQRERENAQQQRRADHERALAQWKSHGHAQCLADVDADFESQRRAEKSKFTREKRL